MVGESGTSQTSKVYRYYKCNNQKRGHSCDKKPIKKDYIEDLVVQEVKKKIFDDELMEQLADKLFELQTKEDTTIPQLKTRIAELQQNINNMLDAIQQGIILPSTKQRLADLEEQKSEVELELIEAEIKSPLLTRDQILWGLTKYRDLDLTTMDERRKLIDGFVNSIYVYDDYLLVTCNYKDGTLKIPFGEIERSDLVKSGVPNPAQHARGFIYPHYSSTQPNGSITHKKKILYHDGCVNAI